MTMFVPAISPPRPARRCAAWLGIACGLALASAAGPTAAVTIDRDPICGAGVCNVDNFDIFGAPVETTLEVDVQFTDMQHIELANVTFPTTNIEFGIGNTGNNVDLDFEITFDLTDEHGNPLTMNQLVVASSASAGFIQALNLPLSELPPAVLFHGFQIVVETTCGTNPTGGPVDCNLFDLRVGGGGGDVGTVVSGPIRFNRAEEGVWTAVPTPGGIALFLAAAAALLSGRGHRTMR